MKKLSIILFVMLMASSMNAQISYVQYRHVPAYQDAKTPLKYNYHPQQSLHNPQIYVLTY